ncbi:gliding motility-associated ABC transporter substrate-binding protein GldG [Flavisolibacter nicotianae]|uniref:gliding motility-associated ABC transporter substrate-binding protein GldG n=1 Tax=Flavisolibacter nicotianae TaxID=2364882 RepID=UPI000EAF3B59|nr:gliding motility-associated ABC transporter substrate-binding protein GldG [Flavisolibacter nicotianae]
MWPICKKELRQFFSSLTGYIAIVVFLLVNGLVLFVLRNNILESGYATLDQFFSFAPWILLFLVAAITMRSFSEEFRSGTFEILQTRPVRNGEIVAGKFFGALAVALIALLPTLVYYFTINSLASASGIDAGAAAGSYLGLALLTGVFTAIGVCVSSFTTNAVVSFIITLIASVLFYYGFRAISELALFQNGADYYIEMFGIDFHYQNISKGVIDTRDLVYFVSVILFFLFITTTRLSAKAGMQKSRQTSVKWAILLLGVLGVNAVAAALHARADLTAEKRYSLTQPTKDLARSLQNNADITIFLKGDFPSGFRKLSASTQEFLRVLKETAPGRINYRFVSPEEEAGGGKTWGDSLRAMGIEPINLTVQVKAGQENKNIFPYGLLQAGGRTEVVNLFPSSKRNISAEELNNAEAMMEYQFAKSLDRVIHPQPKVIAYAVGNGEPVGNEIYDLRQAVAADYIMKPFDVNAMAYIPKEADVLLVVKPASGFTENEKLKIDQYLMNGGKVLCFVDNLHAEPDSLRFRSELIAYDRNLNIGDLLFNYGVRINPDLVMDLQCDFLPFAVGGTPSNPQYEFLHWNYYPLFESRSNHLINKNLGLVAGRFVNSIDTVEAEGIRKTYLLQSSANSRTISTPALISPNENRNTPEDALFRKNGIPVAVLLEGTFSSLYKNRLGQAQRDSLQASGGFKEAGVSPTKMIVVADGDMVLNDVSTQQGPLAMGMNLFTVGSQYEYQFANRNFFLNCLEYLTSNSAIIQTRNKEVVLRALDPKKVETEAGKWRFLTIVLPIVLVILAGVVYQRLRRHRFAS